MQCNQEEDWSKDSPGTARNKKKLGDEEIGGPGVLFAKEINWNS